MLQDLASSFHLWHVPFHYPAALHLQPHQVPHPIRLTIALTTRTQVPTRRQLVIILGAQIQTRRVEDALVSGESRDGKQRWKILWFSQFDLKAFSDLFINFCISSLVDVMEGEKGKRRAYRQIDWQRDQSLCH